jgi:hypothetical protein
MTPKRRSDYQITPSFLQAVISSSTFIDSPHIVSIRPSIVSFVITRRLLSNYVELKHLCFHFLLADAKGIPHDLAV